MYYEDTEQKASVCIIYLESKKSSCETMLIMIPLSFNQKKLHTFKQHV